MSKSFRHGGRREQTERRTRDQEISARHARALVRQLREHARNTELEKELRQSHREPDYMWGQPA